MHPDSLIRRSVVALTLFFFATCDAGPPVQCHNRVKRPDHTPCGLRGKISGDPFELSVNPSAVTSVKDCRDQCVRRGYGYHSCGAFTYNATGKVCTLFGDDQGAKLNPKSDTVLFSRECFACADLACPATPHPKTNLIDNPGFEDSDTLIGPWYVYDGEEGPVLTEVHPVQPGIKSSNGVFVTTGYFYNQGYRQCIGQTHRVEFDIYNVTVEPRAIGSLQCFTGHLDEAGFLYTLTRQPRERARRVIGFYNADDVAEGTGTMSLYAGSGISFNFDNAVVRPVNYTLAKNIGEEIVVNGGFENGTGTWIYNANYGNDHDVGQFDLVQPGLGGTPQALQWSRTMDTGYYFNTLRLIPELRTASVRLGKVHRLSIKTDPVVTITYRFADGTHIIGSSADDQYFYTNAGTFPVVIACHSNENSMVIDKIVIDEFSIHEIDD